MATTQGEFDSAEEAERAVKALLEAGVERGRIRKWNVIPERPPPGTYPSSVGRSAAVGFLFGGITGAILGGSYGASRDAMRPEPPMPDPRGVRVVVELRADGPDPAEILRRSGARNVR